ncbi:Uncharacterised protein [Mycobacteroides abscessus subsp. abscessus]|nr:Uncharacterised protein [Mycobacteroides abscessus subsp. abscessus]
MVTETVQVFRGDTDKYGNPNKTPHGTAQVVFAWGSGKQSGRFRGTRSGRDEATVITAELFVARGTDLKARDRIVRSNGEKYAVVGHQMWDQVEPLSGYDFGWMSFQVESANG